MKKANKASVITLVRFSPNWSTSIAPAAVGARKNKERSIGVRSITGGLPRNSVERGLKQAENRNAQSTARQAPVGEASERGRVELGRETNDTSRIAEVRAASLADEPAVGRD